MDGLKDEWMRGRNTDGQIDTIPWIVVKQYVLNEL